MKIPFWHDNILRLVALFGFIAVYALEIAIVALVGILLGKLLGWIFHLEFNIAVVIALASGFTIVLFHGMGNISNELMEIREFLQKHLDKK